MPGDDVRSIDWNVTARVGNPFVKVFDEERELSVMLLVDASASGDFGTVDQMKGEIAVEICALIAFSAIQNNDRVGLMIFTDEVEVYVPPKKGKKARPSGYPRTPLLQACPSTHRYRQDPRHPQPASPPKKRCFSRFRFPIQRIRSRPPGGPGANTTSLRCPFVTHARKRCHKWVSSN